MEVIPVRIGRNTGNWIATIHYAIDPDKNPATPIGTKWVAEAKKKFAEQQLRDPSISSWAQEMEIQFESFSGRPVFKAFKKELHTNNYPGVLKERELILGFDFGGRNPAYFISQIDMESRWIWHRGVKLDGVGLSTICKQIKATFNDEYSIFYNPNPWKLKIICDVSGTYENSTGIREQSTKSNAVFGKASEILIDQFGITPLAKKIDVKSSIIGVNALFEEMVTTKDYGLTTCICVNPAEKFLIDLCLGGYCYKEAPVNTSEIEKDVPGFNHVGDIIRYVYEHCIRRKINKYNEEDLFISTFEPGLFG